MAHESYKMTIPRSSFDRHTLQQSEFEEKMLSEGFNYTGKPVLVNQESTQLRPVHENRAKPGATVQADNI